MKEIAKSFAECCHCRVDIETSEDVGLGYCLGADPKYLCRKCNSEFGEFTFRRTFQIMKEEYAEYESSTED